MEKLSNVLSTFTINTNIFVIKLLKLRYWRNNKAANQIIIVTKLLSSDLRALIYILIKKLAQQRSAQSAKDINSCKMWTEIWKNCCTHINKKKKQNFWNSSFCLLCERSRQSKTAFFVAMLYVADVVSVK